MQSLEERSPFTFWEVLQYIANPSLELISQFLSYNTVRPWLLCFIFVSNFWLCSVPPSSSLSGAASAYGHARWVGGLGSHGHWHHGACQSLSTALRSTLLELLWLVRSTWLWRWVSTLSLSPSPPASVRPPRRSPHRWVLLASRQASGAYSGISTAISFCRRRKDKFLIEHSAPHVYVAHRAIRRRSGMWVAASLMNVM